MTNDGYGACLLCCMLEYAEDVFISGASRMSEDMRAKSQAYVEESA